VRIGFDAVRALRNSTGLGNYARSLLRSVHRAAPERELVLYAPRPPLPAFSDLPDALGARLVLPPPNPWPGHRAVWRTWRLGAAAARDHVSLYHGLTHEIPRDLPRTGIPSIVTVHDLIFEQHPEYFRRLDRLSYRWRYRWSAQHASAIIAVSAQTRRDLVEWYQVDPARITVVPPICDPAFFQPVPLAEREAVRARYDLPARFLLSLGTFEARKNQALLVAAIARSDAGARLPLVLIGRDGGSRAAIDALARRLGVADRVLVRDMVASADLPALLQGAALFCYPSRAEGFGMPVVEALAAGVPVVAADLPCLIEAGGPASRYVSPDDVDGWAGALAELTADRGAAEPMRAAGVVHAATFDGDRVAAKLLAVYDAVVTSRALP
jgi:glycosyltransferase involved in cell wall biosynthesis